MKCKFLTSLALGIWGVGLALAAPSSLVKRTARTSTPSGCLTVRGTGTLSGEYSTLTAALAALGTTTTAKCIFVYGGTYNEAVTINYKGPLTLYGYTTDTGSYKSNTATFQRTISSSAAGSLDASSTANIVSTNFKAYNINFRNNYGAGAQAVAVTANGDKQGYYGCGFHGYQDTLYVKAGKQYFSNCYMEGATDYIFGNAAVWFGECTVANNAGGVITASSRTTADEPTWFVFDHSTITAAKGLTLTGKVNLGRPWRVLARVIFQNSVLTDVVTAAGWTTLAANATPLFYEINNTGAGSDTSKRVYESQISAPVSKTTLFGSDYGTWIDGTY